MIMRKAMTWAIAAKTTLETVTAYYSHSKDYTYVLAKGSLPKYRFWYHVRGPVTAGSGAGPRGSFS